MREEYLLRVLRRALHPTEPVPFAVGSIRKRRRVMRDQKVIGRPASLVCRFDVSRENGLSSNARIRKEPIRAFEPCAVERFWKTQLRILCQSFDDRAQPLVQSFVL